MIRRLRYLPWLKTRGLMANPADHAEAIIFQSQFFLEHWKTAGSQGEIATVLNAISYEIDRLEQLAGERPDLGPRIALLVGDWLLLRRRTRLRALH